MKKLLSIYVYLGTTFVSSDAYVLIDVPKNNTKHKATATSFLKRLAFILKKQKLQKTST